ncbi:MAG: hypothetical protein RQ752_08730 [Thermohalobaculum sp.]|nr:hypothetical protein [Thermohalobaculum sp.]
MSAAAPGPIHEDDDLRIDRIDGRGGRLVLAFTGIGHGSGGLQRAEFVRSASQDGANTVLFVTDVKRSWYSAPGLLDRLRTRARAVWDELGQPAIVTIGNSMGGFGAILAARDLPVRAVLAFGPQFSMDESVVREPRWRQWRANFGPLPVRALDEVMIGGTECATRFYLFHGTDGVEQRQIRGFPAAPHVRHYLFDGAPHNVALPFKEAGTLDALIGAVAALDDTAVHDIATAVGARPRHDAVAGAAR